jgi:hypothetical protein
MLITPKAAQVISRHAHQTASLEIGGKAAYGWLLENWWLRI